MTQIDMFESRYPDVPGHKTPGPSQEAAEAIQGRASILREKCHAYVKRWGMTGSTADECAEALKESVLSIRPRFTELLRENRIQDTGARRKNASGRSATVWKLARPSASAPSEHGNERNDQCGSA